MAFIPYFIIGPTSILSIIGLLRGPDKTVPTPAEDWRKATVDLLIPSYNEEKTIILCLSSLSRQTLKPRQIYIVDDASKDHTVTYARLFAEFKHLDIKIIKRELNEGKTPSVYHICNESDADVIALLDADTILRSSNYLERIVEELYQGVGIASACGMVLPLTEADRKREFKEGELEKFSMMYPYIDYSPDKTWFQLTQRAITNSYREELYLFLQRSVYNGEMVFFGTLIFPIGCAVVYRRQYLKNIFDKYVPLFGFDLTTSEDIFFGFAFAQEGYKNTHSRDVYAMTGEPRILKMHKQIFKWSSSFLQSCYYFDDLFLTPFRSFKAFKRRRQEKNDPNIQKAKERRRIQEAYRQPFGENYTRNFGRNIGWFIFTTAIEKMSFPTFIVIFALLQLWEPLLITLGAETLLYSTVIAIMHKNRRLRNFFKAILFTPIRYFQVLFELVVISNLILDLWISKNRKWRK
ncbi:glycosyltransferase, family 2 [Legionella beliardensis]|uniref:Glycosyltransferase, family 2 n=1 Tax=Legionella beliardensis TaxID=91822 RepID=A0A378I3K4_9GAMM|nr:glycosyltransferase [Legionella beliardensis]STX29748.1 glycosyltransferase, family 2 [Legionella beliardensis]